MTEDDSLEDGEGEEEDENPLGIYDGERNKAGDRHGFGYTLLPNGDYYFGEYCKGLRHGHGVYGFNKSGAFYEGDWRRGVKYGRGIFIYPDGTRYEGEWKHNKRHGFGKYYYRNLDIYEGSWVRGYRHGVGTYTYNACGSKFYGTWVWNRQQGPGQLIYQRHRFHGFWETNLTIDEPPVDENEAEENSDDKREKNLEEPAPLKHGYISVWRARLVTAYNPDLLPPEPMPLQQEITTDSLSGTCENDEPSIDVEEYLKHDIVSCEGEECEGEAHDYELDEV